MKTKLKKPNTVSEVHRRIRKLEDLLREFPELTKAGVIPNYDFSPSQYQNAILLFLSRRQIPFERLLSGVSSGIDKIVLPKDKRGEYLANNAQAKLDTTESVYRLANKILKKIGSFENPTPYSTRILRAFLPLSDKNVVSYRDMISDIISYDKKGNFRNFILINGLDFLARKYNLSSLNDEQISSDEGYQNAFGLYLTNAKKLVKQYGKSSLSDLKVQDLIDDFKLKHRLPINVGDQQTHIEGADITFEYLTNLSSKDLSSAILKLQREFGLLAGVIYDSRASTTLSSVQLWFIRGRNAHKYHFVPKDKVTSALRKLITIHLIDLVRNNHRGIVYVKDEGRTYKGLNQQLVPHQHLLHRTNLSIPYLEKYFI